MSQSKVRNKECEDNLYNYQITIVLTGTPQLEDAINKHLQTKIEHYFLEKGETVKFLEITGINQKIN